LTSESNADASTANRAAQRAVFLSYASEDAPAAQKICAALRAGGVEVWFDQSELRGGDAWDAAIRRQIKSCVLFLPVISANAHARTEGYFRLEWKLAVDRSHLLAPDQAFVVPVAIDNTPQSDERLPDRFRELQWTRLPAGNTPPEFVERIKRLLTQDIPRSVTPQHSDAAAGETVHAGAYAADVAATGRPSAGLKILPWLGLTVVVAAGCFGIYRLMLSKHASVPEATATTAATHLDKSVAVLPFADESANKDQGYFSDGLSDELIDMLGKIPDLRVPARTSSFYFKGRQATLGEIGSTLKVANVLEGTVRKSGSALRISAELIRVTDDTRVWSETYDRKLDDVFKVQDDIANSVVAALKVSMLGEPKVRAAPTTSSEAYLHYLRAREALQTDDDSGSALPEIERAVELDPSFAQAWQLLGTWHMNAFVGGGHGTYEAVHSEVLTALQRALTLDPSLADTHAELARLYYTLDFDAGAARPELERALSIDPKNGSALWLAGYIDDASGRFDDAITMHSRGRDLDPLFADNYIQLGNTYYRAGRLPEAAAAFSTVLQRFPLAHTVHYRLGLVLLAQQKPQAALTEFSLEQQPDFRDLGIPLALERLGSKQAAEKMLTQALPRETVSGGAAYQIALVHACAGDKDQTFQWLERAYRQRDAGMHWMKFDPLLQAYRGDPRFQALLAQMHET
jgi:TolB-like protein/cytochrome c-type biogenesis protein CcmH/NrfG